MKIAFILGEFPLLSETFIVNQIAGMVSLGHDVRIFSIKKNEGKVQHPKIKEYRLLKKTTYLDIPRNRFLRVLKVPYLILRNLPNIKILKSLNVSRYGVASLALYNLYFADLFLKSKEKFDIIHCYFGGRGIYGLCLKDINIKGKLITTFCGGDILNPEKSFGKNIYPLLFEKSDLIIAITPFVKEKLIQSGCPNEKITIIPMGTDTKLFKPLKAKPGAKFTSLLTVGRLSPEKGHRYSIQAVKSLLKKNYPIKYFIVGDGTEYSSLSSLANNPNIIFLRGVKQGHLKSLYGNSDIFILPSVSNKRSIEGQGVVLQEAQASGLPVISTNIGGIKHSLIDSKTGFIVKERNSKALAVKIEFLINNPDIRKQMGINGRKFVEQNYDLAKLNNTLSDKYNELQRRIDE